MFNHRENKDVVIRWFAAFWGNPWHPTEIGDLAASDMILQYSHQTQHRGLPAIRAFMTGFRAAVPDLKLRSVGELVADRDFVVARWEGGGTHGGLAFNALLIGPLPAASGQKVRLTGTSAFRLRAGQIAEEAVWTLGVDLDERRAT